MPSHDLAAPLTLSAAAPGTYASADLLTNVEFGIKLVVDITAISGGATLTVTIRGKDKSITRSSPAPP